MALTKAKLEELIAVGEIEVGGGGVNPNILHNWDFRNPVNQRGVSGVFASGYSIDRWKANKGTSAMVTGGIKVGGHATLNSTFIQYIEFPEQYVGKTVTLSAKIEGVTGANSNVRLRTATTHIGGTPIPTADGIVSETITIPPGISDISTLGVWVYAIPPATLTVSAVKLELGTVSTLHLDPPMDYGTELLKCQRFFYSLGSNVIAVPGYTSSATVGYVAVPCPVPMRSIPTHIGTTPTFRVNGSNYVTTVTGITLNNHIIRLALSATGLPATQTANAYLGGCEFSADL